MAVNPLIIHPGKFLHQHKNSTAQGPHLKLKAHKLRIPRVHHQRREPRETVHKRAVIDQAGQVQEIAAINGAAEETQAESDVETREC